MSSSPSPAWVCPLCGASGTELGVKFCPQDGVPVRVVEPEGAAWLGKILAGKYRIERWLGAGGFAEVFEATALPSGRAVAVKVLNAAFAATAGAAERFRREAELISLLAHPNVVAIQDFGTDADGAPFMVMELLTGESLGERLEREPLPPRIMLRLGMQICEGLAAAHERGIVHRDIKPDNLFLVDGPEPGSLTVKILDLGIAKIVVGAATAPGLTLQGTVIGTPEYMSPEQAAAGTVGPASDVYSLGCVLWEALLGEPPFRDAHTIGILAKHLAAAPSWPAELARARGVPEGAQALLLRALAKDPAARQGSMLELQAEIAAVLGRSRFPTSEPAPTQQGVAPRAAEPGASQGVVTVVALESGRTDDDAVVEIAPDTFWVGRRQGALLGCNPYLRRFRHEGREVTLLIDPGGEADWAVVRRKTAAVCGSLERLDYVFVNHQDPDVAGVVPQILAEACSARLVGSRDTWRLLQVRGLDGQRFVATESVSGGEVALPALERLEFVPSPFCHFRGAVMLYDPASRVLFTGDLGAGLSDVAGLVAGNQGLVGVTLFHQIYMPSSWALAAAVARIRALDPAPAVLAPQHGALWLGDAIAGLLDHLEQLPVGIDLLYAEAAGPAAAQRPVAVANEILDALALLVGEEQTFALVRRYASDGTFTDPFELRGTREVVGFKVDPEAGLATLLRDVLDLAPAESRSVLERVVRRALDQHRVSLRRPRSRSEQPAGYRQVFEPTTREPRSRPPRR